MTATATAETALVPTAPLRPSPDQRERWIAHGSPIPFDRAAQLVRAAHADDGERDDIAAHDLRTWAFGSNDGQAMQLVPVPFPGRPRSGPVALRELAFTQLAHRIGAPPGYIRELPPKLQIANMNWALTREARPALLRLAAGEVRAVVSEKYVALDDELLLDVVHDVLAASGHRDDALVRATAVGPHTVLRITVPSGGVAVKPGDVIEWGVDIANSELGLRSVQVTPITFRLVCSNGMRAWRSEAGLRLRHIGDPKRLHEQLRDAVPIAFAEARGDIEKWKRAVDVLVESALDEIESLRALGLSNSELHAISREVAALPANTPVETINGALRAAPTTVFDVANAVTSVASTRPTVESRLSLEEVGHRYLSRRAG